MDHSTWMLCGFGAFLMSAKMSENLVIIGHRGASGLEIENTLESFEKAIKLGVDMVELDVHQCKSGHLVVFHDDTVDRLTDGSGYIGEMTLAQLRKLNVQKNYKISTLDEVLQLINKRCKVNIELKGNGTGKSVALLLRRYLKQGWLPEMFLVTSFNFYELNDFHEVLSFMPIGIIFDRLPIDYTLFAQQLGVQAMMMQYALIAPSLIEKAKARNLRIYAWTVNKIMDAKKLIKLGVDGIVTNYPDKMIGK